MILARQCTEAQRRLIQIFADQCREGEQTKKLPPEAAACGQFLGDPGRTHRGLHGSAAAIRVLGDGGADARDLSCRILTYLTNRSDIERRVLVNSADTLNKIAVDERNVIKLSETLFALRFIPLSECDAHPLVTDLAKRLDEARVGRGWNYFTDTPGEEADPVPTAFAVRALAAHQLDVGIPASFLLEVVQGGIQADLFVQALCLFALTFLPNQDGIDPKMLGRALTKLWRRLSSLLSQDLEANIEFVDFTREDYHYHYVRIPWQLYLLAVAARLSPLRRYSSTLAQRRMEGIIAAVNGPTGFHYPHSGRRMSSRTSAILYDVLGLIASELATHRLMALSNPFLAADRLRSAIATRVVVAVAALYIVIASVDAWVHRQPHRLSDLGPALMAGFLIAVLTWLKPRES